MAARKQLEEAIAQNETRWDPVPDKTVLKAAIDNGEGEKAIGDTPGTEDLCKAAQELFDRISEEEKVMEALTTSVESKDDGDIRDAIEKAKAIKFEHALIKEGEEILEAAAKARAEAAAAAKAAGDQKKIMEALKKARPNPS